MKRILNLVLVALFIFSAASAFAQCKENEEHKRTEEPFEIFSVCYPKESTYEESYVELVIPASAPAFNEMEIIDLTRGWGKNTIANFAREPKPRERGEARMKLMLPYEFSLAPLPTTDKISLGIELGSFGYKSTIDNIIIRLRLDSEPDGKTLPDAVMAFYSNKGKKIKAPGVGFYYRFIDAVFSKPYARVVRAETETVLPRQKNGKKVIETTHWIWDKDQKKWLYESTEIHGVVQ